jgi:hypothetical protein
MILLWRLLSGQRLERISGLEYLSALLARQELRVPNAVFWVMPTEAARDRNLAWLSAQGIAVGVEDCYVAPLYGAGDLSDPILLATIKSRRPRHVIIALGGGVQERLGYFSGSSWITVRVFIVSARRSAFYRVIKCGSRAGRIICIWVGCSVVSLLRGVLFRAIGGRCG